MEPTLPTDAIPTAVTPIPATPGALTVITGVVEYPTPPSVRMNLIRPLYVVSTEQVAAAPAPAPPYIVIVGGTVYPAKNLERSDSDSDSQGLH